MVTLVKPNKRDASSREARLRRIARRRELILRKSRRRNPDAPDFGGYWLIDPYYNALIFGDQLGATLDEIEAFLMSE